MSLSSALSPGSFWRTVGIDDDHHVFVTAAIGSDGVTRTCHVQRGTAALQRTLCFHAVAPVCHLHLKLAPFIKSHESSEQQLEESSFFLCAFKSVTNMTDSTDGAGMSSGD